MKKLHCGDNLEYMRGLNDETIDLIYLDPPFNSNRDWGEFDDRREWDEYLAYMAVRLLEMHRLLKSSGSIYLHCDPTMSHYLKVISDSIFGRKNFRNEIVWKRTSGKKTKKQWGNEQDIVLYYTKGDSWTFNVERTPLTKEQTASYKYKNSRGNFKLGSASSQGMTYFFDLGLGEIMPKRGYGMTEDCLLYTSPSPRDS